MVAREIKRVRNASVFRAATNSPCQHQNGRDIMCLTVLCCGLEPDRASLDGECQQVFAWMVVNGWKGRQHMPRAVNRAS